MDKWIVKRGNTSIQDIPIKDKAGDLIENLSVATSIKFQVKDAKEASSAKIEKTAGNGIEVNVPSTGYLRITLLPSDTILNIKEYVMGLEIVWSAALKWETLLEINGEEIDVFEIVQDTIL